MPVYRISREDRATIAASEKYWPMLCDNGHHDHDTHHTMTFSHNMAQALARDLGITPQWHHAIHHVPPEPGPTEASA